MINEELQKLVIEEKWDKVSKIMKDYLEITIPLFDEIIQELIEVFFEIIDVVCKFWKQFKPAYFVTRLQRYGIPYNLAWFIANHWPERWLPIPKFGDE
jgi:hypothetical protein